MQKFRNILFISRGLITNETDALKQALNVARMSNAELRVLILYPELSREMLNYKEKYDSLALEQFMGFLQDAREATQTTERDVPVLIELKSGSTPAVLVIREVLKNAHDLLIKAAEPKEGRTGFRAIDMELLRKCPCPVWLSCPIEGPSSEIKVAVAIDPESKSPEGHDLSLRLLQLSRSLADRCNGELNVISCWEYEFQAYLSHNPWIKIESHEMIKLVSQVENQHRAALDGVVKESGIGGKINIHHLRGYADKIIPRYVANSNIDILVMGTVARTGIPGFFFGNTAENIVQQLECSLLALKPNGFVSPVKAY